MWNMSRVRADMCVYNMAFIASVHDEYFTSTVIMEAKRLWYSVLHTQISVSDGVTKERRPLETGKKRELNASLPLPLPTLKAMPCSRQCCTCRLCQKTQLSIALCCLLLAFITAQMISVTLG